jgi:5-methylcytosine-specific restriction endonuclease McrA
MREFAKTFYKSSAWRACRSAYLKQAHGLCELCLKRGRYTAADTVHHITHLTPGNITDPLITLNPDNLMALCRDCHAEIHRGAPIRYKIDAFGHVITRD